jgi:hypothetical protein
VTWAESRGLADGQWLGYTWDDPEIVAPEDCRYDVALEVDHVLPEGEIGRFAFPPIEHLDANGDGRADVTIVKEGGREVCRAVDLNLDGRVDVWAYMDDRGQLRRREYDFDRDGAIDQIVTYQGGVPTASQRATLLANRLDTWDYYQNGMLARTERDSDSDARVDQWWEYPKPGCPLIHSDANQDGKPDPGTTIDYCKETGYVPPERQYYRQAEGPNFRDQLGTPTEVENREVDAPAEAAPKESK